MKIIKDFGIILRRTDYGEADRIMTFLMRDHGKTRAIAKGVRKAKSKMAGGLELFSVSEVHFIKGKGDIDTLTSTRLVTHYGTIVTQLERTELAYQLIKIIDKTIEDQTGQEYFPVLNESLAALNDTRIPPLLTELSFTMRVLQLLGNLPDFSRDTSGVQLNPDKLYDFDAEAVSFVVRSDGPYNKNHLKVLKLLAHNSPQAMAAVQGIGPLVSDIAGLVRGLRAQSLNL